jgi:hypothetical protein
MATGTSPVQAQAPAIPERLAIESLPLEERIRRRAHEIWLQNGSLSGTDLIDWLEAEKGIPSQE